MSGSDKKNKGSTSVAENESPECHEEPFIDDRMRNILVSLQKTWLDDYSNSREKILVDVTERLHNEFSIESQRTKNDLVTQFKEELEASRAEWERNHAIRLQDALKEHQEKHEREIRALKKKQWCYQCETEAIYHCCWNTAYCSVECQQNHWNQHRRACRRRNRAAAIDAVNEDERP
uniref:MYND-type domain-containing protein n=1 Tax=Rhabditophanes sp. KR3021 TaxID=114890 RepID=A0AC35UA35_9BILA